MRGELAQIRKNHAPSHNSGNREVNKVWCGEAQSLEVGQAGWKGHEGVVLWLEPWATCSLKELNVVSQNRGPGIARIRISVWNHRFKF